MNPDAFYDALDPDKREIRLLIINAAAATGQIDCSVEIVSLDTNPSFFALSYVWGDPNLTEDVLMNDRVVTVTSNLAVAIRHVRRFWDKNYADRPKTELKLWADAVCIHQEDLAEKSHQVNFMHSIYFTAEKVISWLGPITSRIDIAMDTFRIIGEEVTEADINEEDGKPMDFEWMRKYPLLCRDNYFANAILFFHLPYWTRIWIFQEVVLAKRLILLCGDQSIDYEDIRISCLWLRRLRFWVINSPRQHPDYIPRSTWVQWADANLQSETFICLNAAKSYLNDKGVFQPDAIWYMSNLMYVQGFSASKSLDYVYGMLGLTGLPIEPDYNKSESQVFQDYALEWLNSTKTLDLLRYGGIGTVFRPYGLPSWIPNYRFMYQTYGVCGFTLGQADVNVFTMQDVPETILKDFKMYVYGVNLFPVKKIWKDFSELNRYNGCNFEIVADYIKRYPRYPTGMHPLNAIFRLYVSADRTESQINQDLTVFPHSFMDIMFGKSLKSFLTNPEDLGLKPRPELWLSLKVAFADSSIFPSEDGFNEEIGVLGSNKVGISQILHENFRIVELGDEGYLGLVPMGTMLGDIICVVKDCGIPLCLRPVNDHFIYLGPCWVIGFMAGEARELVLKDTKRIERFEIH